MTESTKRLIKPSGVERFFREDEVIVSKTDLKGRLTYVNRVFINLAGYQELELLGAPHSLIRHPDMPRSVFKLLGIRSVRDAKFSPMSSICPKTVIITGCWRMSRRPSIKTGRLWVIIPTAVCRIVMFSIPRLFPFIRQFWRRKAGTKMPRKA